MQRRGFLKSLLSLSAIGITSNISLAHNIKMPTSFNILLEDNNRMQDLKILIPLYSYPNWWDSQNYIWKKIIDLKSKYKDIEIVAIVNPNNGDFDSSNSDYERGIKDLINADIKVVGYIYTQYGYRAKESIIKNLESWKKYYGSLGVSGIFFDETSTDSQLLKYYRELSNEAKKRDFDFIILNPGITTDQRYINSGIAQVVVSYENPYSELHNNPPSKYNEPSVDTELSLLIYEMEDDHVDELISFAREHKFSYIYFTEDGFDSNPWDSISKYLEKEIEESIDS